MGKIIYKKGYLHGNWKGGKPHCMDCGILLSSVYAKRCVVCAAKERAIHPEYIKKLSSAKKGKMPSNFYKIQPLAWEAITGRRLTEEHKKKIGDSHRGEKSYMWIKDRRKIIKRQERNDSAYCAWRMEVYRRDNFKCKISNKDCTGRIEAHHILGWTEFPELRYQVNNGITLCHFHHPRTRYDERELSPYFLDMVLVKV